MAGPGGAHATASGTPVQHAGARAKPGCVVRFLVGRLYSVDEEVKRRAVRTLGALLREPGLLSGERVFDLVHRLLWALNDESGAVPFGAPEALGEILAEREEFRASVLPVLVGMLSEEDTFQTGAIERGLYWALERIGPDALRVCPEACGTVASATERHPDPETRAAAARALAALDSGRDSEPDEASGSRT